MFRSFNTDRESMIHLYTKSPKLLNNNTVFAEKTCGNKNHHFSETSVKNINSNSFKTAQVTFGGLFYNPANAKNVKSIVDTKGWAFSKNKGVLWFINKAANNQTLFDALFALGINCGIRPAAIMMQGGDEDYQKNKKAAAHSITSGLVGYGMAVVLFSPISNALKLIKKDAPTYAKKAMDFLTFNNTKKIGASKRYQTLVMLFNYTPQILTSSMRSAATIAMIPYIDKYVISKIFKPKNKTNLPSQQPQNYDEFRFQYLNFKKNIFQSFMGGVK